MSMGFTGAASINAVHIPFISETLTSEDTFDDNGGVYGSRDMREERVVKTRQAVGGNIMLRPTPVELDGLFNLLTGDTKGGDNLVEFQAVGPTAHDVIIDKGYQIYTYANTKINTMTLRASSGGVLTCGLDYLGLTEAASGSLTPTPTHNPPYVMSECVLTIGGVAHPISEIVVAITNNLHGDSFYNSLTRTQIPAGRHVTTVTPTIPFDDAAAEAMRVVGITGATCTVVFTKGSNVLTFTIPNLKFPQQTPQISDRDAEIFYSPVGTAYATAAAASLVITSVLA